MELERRVPRGLLPPAPREDTRTGRQALGKHGICGLRAPGLPASGAASRQGWWLGARSVARVLADRAEGDRRSGPLTRRGAHLVSI